MIKVGEVEIKPGRFPDNSLALKLNEDVFRQYTFRKYEHPRNIGVEITWSYEDDSEMFVLQCVVDILRRMGYVHISLYMPYLVHARMDRIKSPEENFSLKVFAEWLNGLNFESVQVNNVHSVVSEALIKNIHNVTPERDIIYCIGRYHPDMIFFPDEGACKRYGDLDVIKNSNLPVAFGIKKRDWKTGDILGLDVVGENVEGKDILIIDDICSAGGTFYHSGKKLREMGAKDVALYVTHCEDTIEKGELLTTDYISKIYTTNSICHIEHEKIEIVNRFY